MDELTKAEFRRVDDENIRQNRRIGELETTVKEIQKISISVEKLATNMSYMLEEQRKQGERLSELENKPAETWTAMQRTFFTTVCSALAGAVAYGIMQMIAAYAAH